MARVCRLLSVSLQLDLGGSHWHEDARSKAEPAFMEVGIKPLSVCRRNQRPFFGSGEAPRVSSRVCHWKVQIFCKTVNSGSREPGMQ